jgi:hypothetical protein
MKRPPLVPLFRAGAVAVVVLAHSTGTGPARHGAQRSAGLESTLASEKGGLGPPKSLTGPPPWQCLDTHDARGGGDREEHTSKWRRSSGSIPASNAHTPPYVGLSPEVLPGPESR